MAQRVVVVSCVLVLVFANVVVWQRVTYDARPRVLSVSFLDVGQGDSIFIESPTRTQVLIDGGPDRAVLRELASVMPWWDRHIDLVVATHPDADHVSGLVDVLQRFTVGHIVEPGVAHNTPQAESMLRSVSEERHMGARYTYARRGNVFDLGAGVTLEILFPDRDVSGLESNTASIVARLAYGTTSFLFTGDAPASIESYLARLDGVGLQSTVLKAGHHGSRTSSSLAFVGSIRPAYAVFSRGCSNTYGHPHKEVVDIFTRFSVTIRDTCTDGAVRFLSDGHTVKTMD